MVSNQSLEMVSDKYISLTTNEGKALNKVAEHYDNVSQNTLLGCGKAVGSDFLKLIYLTHIKTNELIEVLGGSYMQETELLDETGEKVGKEMFYKSTYDNNETYNWDKQLINSNLPDQDQCDISMQDNITKKMRWLLKNTPLGKIVGINDFGISPQGVLMGLKHYFNQFGLDVHLKTHSSLQEIVDQLRKGIPVPVLYMVDSMDNPHKKSHFVPKKKKGLHYGIVYSIDKFGVNIFNPFGRNNLDQTGQKEVIPLNEFIGRRNFDEEYIQHRSMKGLKKLKKIHPRCAFFLKEKT